MTLKFKSLSGEVRTKGKAQDFRKLVDARAAADQRGATFSFDKKTDKLIFWGAGSEIDRLLSGVTFQAITSASAGLRLEIKWLPMTKRGGKKMVIAATKAVVKEVATTAAKASAAVATHGVTPVIDISASVVEWGKTAVKAAKGEITIAPNNMDLDWEVRIVIERGNGDAAGIVAFADRSVGIGQVAHRGRIQSEFREAMGKYSVSVENAVLLAGGNYALRYNALLDDDDTNASLARLAAKEAETTMGRVNEAYDFFKEMVNAPSSSGYLQLIDEKE